MVDKDFNENKKDPPLPQYKQTKLPNSWLLSKTEDFQTNETKCFETIPSQRYFDALIKKMEKTDGLVSSHKRPVSNIELQQIHQSMKRLRTDNDKKNENDISISGLDDNVNKMANNGSLRSIERHDITNNNHGDSKKNTNSKISVTDYPVVSTLRQSFKSLLPICQSKSRSPITISIRNKQGRSTDKIPIEKTVPGCQLMFGHLIDHAFQDTDNLNRLQTIREIFSYICKSGGSSMLFTNMSDSLCDNAGKLCVKLESMASTKVNFLAELISQWDYYQKVLANINDICSEINFHYIIKENRASSLLEFGIQIYTDMLSRSLKIRTRVTANLVYLIKCERNDILPDNILARRTLKLMYERLPTYVPYFETELISTTEHYYNKRSSSTISSMSINNYIVYAIKLILAEPILKAEYSEYLLKTSKPPIDIVMTELILTHIDYIVQKGFKSLIDQDHCIPLRLLYLFVSKYDEIAQIQAAFGQYIKDECEKICQTYRIIDQSYHARSSDGKQRSLHFVESLLRLKSRMNDILGSCFDDNTGFRHTLKDSFEAAINLHQVASAQHIACYIDLQLESPWPFSLSVNRSLDDGVGLLRSLQAEEVFKSHYKIVLGMRLLKCHQQQDVVDRCTNMARRLESACGATFTKDLDAMINDIQQSQRQVQRFKDDNRLITIEPTKRIDMNVLILARESWSLRPWSQQIKLPSLMLKHQEIYHKFYQQEEPRRRLNWISSLGTCTIEAAYPQCKLQLITTEIQGLILLLFNNTSDQSLSVKQICQQTGIDQTHVKKSLAILASQKTPFLRKQKQTMPCKGGDLIIDDVFSYNKEFNSTQSTIEIQDLSSEFTSSSLKIIKHQALFTKKEKVQALLMKILKQHRHLSIDELQKLVAASSQAIRINLPLDNKLIASELAHLVDRRYLDHKPEHNEYIYNE